MTFSVRKRKAFQQSNGDSLGSIADIIYGKSATGDLLTQFLDSQAIDSTVLYTEYAEA